MCDNLNNNASNSVLGNSACQNGAGSTPEPLTSAQSRPTANLNGFNTPSSSATGNSTDTKNAASPTASTSDDKQKCDSTKSSGHGKRNCCLTVVVMAVLLMIVGLCGCVALAIMSTDTHSSLDAGLNEYSYKALDNPVASKSKYQTNKQFAENDRIVFLPISGTIGVNDPRSQSLFCTPDDLHRVLEYLKEDDKISALVLEINSPGGTVTDADMMLHELQQFKKTSKLPVYAYFKDIACSGGYYVAMAADTIYACPTTMTGSIGVIMQIPNVSKLMGKVGVEMMTITSLNSEGKKSFKDIGSMFRQMRPEERAMLQSLITDTWERFVGVVSEGRKGHLTKAQVRKLADGRVFSAKQALNAKIIDGISYPDEFCAKIRKDLHNERAIAVRIIPKADLFNSLSLLGMQAADLVRTYQSLPLANGEGSQAQTEVLKRAYLAPLGAQVMQ